MDEQPGKTPGQRVGYARVSSDSQNTARQVEVLKPVTDRLYVDVASGKDRVGRPELAKMLEFVRAGDTVVTKSPDRLARSASDLLNLCDELLARNVQVEFLDQPTMNTNTPQGKFALTILGAVAEMERAITRERQAEGIAIAKAKGTYKRDPKLTSEQIENARDRISNGVPKALIAREYGVSRTTLLNALNRKGIYESINNA